MALQTFWEQEFKRPICTKTFHSLCVFSDAIKIKDRDSDSKPTYDGVSALLFQPVTCPDCLYTTFENDFEVPLSQEQKELLTKLCEKLKTLLSVDLSRERTLKDGGFTFHNSNRRLYPAWETSKSGRSVSETRLDFQRYV